ncbi:hypothetical protein N9L68_05400 [bacterium]|nr:hypothetical protein [bacterium]
MLARSRPAGFLHCYAAPPPLAVINTGSASGRGAVLAGGGRGCGSSEALGKRPGQQRGHYF